MSKIQQLISNQKTFPIIVGFCAGLYPFFFYYSNNFTLINSFKHLLFFGALFLFAPSVLLFVTHYLFKNKIQNLNRLLLFLNLSFFGAYTVVAIKAGFDILLTVIVIVVSLALSYFFYKYLKKIMVLQLILAFLAFFALVPKVYKQLFYSDSWQELPDAIVEVAFNKTPNVYFIQPDGYVNFSEIEKEPYLFNNNDFKSYLTENNFSLYPNFRNNYTSTLSSNSSIFAMKHHYFNNNLSFNEAVNARKIIVSENPVLEIFKKNGYKTYILSEGDYFFLNKNKIGYDQSNFTEEEISFMSTGLRIRKNVLPTFKEYISEDASKKFFFIQIFNPRHITSQKVNSKGKEAERESYIEGVKIANRKLSSIISEITTYDPNALIVIMADHGGYVGFDYTAQSFTKTTDPMLVKSIYSSILAIKWPNGSPDFDETKIKSSVNIFRFLFSYLSDDASFLNFLEEDSSFNVINEGAPKGIYKYINDQGEVVFDLLRD